MAYEPEPRKWEDRNWLYEKYWGELLSSNEVAELAGVAGHTIRDKMDELGIPKRLTGYNRDNPVSAFSGFYTDKAGPVDDTTQEEHDPGQPDKDDDWQPAWADIADNDPAVGSAAQFGD